MFISQLSLMKQLIGIIDKLLAHAVVRFIENVYHSVS